MKSIRPPWQRWLCKKETGITSFREHQDKMGNTVGVASWLIVLTLTMSLLLGASPAGANGQVRVIQLLQAPQVLKSLQELYHPNLRFISLDMTNVDEIDSSALATLAL